MKNLLAEAQELFPYTRDLRRDFHRHPELGLQEHRTAKIVAEELKKLDLDVKTGIGETGVVALLEGAKPGPVVLMRVDMDALPMEEESDAEYASENPGVMHACGHDGHVAMGLTIAKMLHAHRDELAGTVKLVFQPAEEGDGGAEKMVQDGVLENPRPDYSLSLHVWNEQPLSWFGITQGPIMASAGAFKITVRGKGGHGAVPHQAVDPIFASSQIISALQGIVSRNTPPLDSAVVSVCSIHGGTAFNIIPPEVELQGTIRTFKPEIRTMVVERLHETADNTAQALGCEVNIKHEDITPAVINDPDLAEQIAGLAAEMFPDSTIALDSQTMGAEDMAFMMEDFPSCYFLIGSANAEKGLNAPHHHPRFDFDEQALTNGVALMSAAVMSLLEA
jgi:amidohydrolase